MIILLREESKPSRKGSKMVASYPLHNRDESSCIGIDRCIPISRHIRYPRNLRYHPDDLRGTT